MSNLSLLKKAREILAHAQESPIPGPNTIQTTREISLAACQRSQCQPSEAQVEPPFLSGQSLPTGDTPQPNVSSEPMDIMPAAQNARAVYWETGTGRILGPAVPEFLARNGSTFWIVTTFEGQPRWINADWLRSRRAFENQPEVRECPPFYSGGKTRNEAPNQAPTLPR